MKLSAVILFAACSPLSAQVYAAHSAYCTDNRDGTGAPTYQITKDCCAATREHSTTSFWENDSICRDAAGLGNGINLGRFVKCCGDRGAGSHSSG
ncbi:uncharacterized protein UMAG_11002 [Mycosarcoma maydis]|uniref:Uncharacterized protein n=1 Tax=Mycosarcoma maydis TaxID=5270 RepID=A0A0D1DME2_MYCMD|nr:uncharacterized protein UMAG_11002 [Ustilago maydis 521]KIS65679.1 hypothetical protein UMAG_11002 [Ustilago maydis 521]|eukprot:XP_011392742.1 hypothetical protein UMAG_11002 [Ustilago maydis 521]